MANLNSRNKVAYIAPAEPNNNVKLEMEEERNRDGRKHRKAEEERRRKEKH